MSTTEPTRELELSIEIRDSIAEIASEDWNALSNEGNPFLTYEFLHGLESTGCMGRHNGWYPRYILLWHKSTPQKLVGAMPCYLKTNSYGEFVFDWAWAEAFERHNMPYYPKLVCSVPFTPATGPRILVHSELFSKERKRELQSMLARAAQQYCVSESYSGVHWLFTEESECELLCAEVSAMDDHGETDDESDKEADKNADEETAQQKELLRRIDCQYHWHNDNYASFDDFLSKCTAKRRKTIRRERRYVTDANIRLTKRMGASLSDREWQWVHELYSSTFDRKWGNPSLTLEFFKQIGATFGGNVLIVFAHDESADEPDKPIACSVMFFGNSVLYGRYWGCREERHSLHFEACYYQGIEFCIERGLQIFEPGAQGEHKITRGFVPTITRSAHFIAHPGFRDAIAEFLAEERPYVVQRCDGLTDLLPFKHSDIRVEN